MQPDHTAVNRHTLLYVVCFASILQSATSLVSLASYAHLISSDWHTLVATYSVQQRIAWAMAAAWSAVSLVAVVAVLRRRAWGRTLYACGAAVTIAAWFVLLPWVLALSAVLPVAVMMAALYGKAGSRHRAMPATIVPRTRRRVAALMLCAVSGELFYSAYLGMTTGHGWMRAQFGDGSPGRHFLVSLVLLAVAAWLAERGQRAWRCGVTLMAFVLAIVYALIGFMPYAKVFASYRGTAFRSFEIDWGPLGFGVALFAVAAWLLLAIAAPSRPKRAPPPHGELPDFS